MQRCDLRHGNRRSRALSSLLVVPKPSQPTLPDIFACPGSENEHRAGSLSDKETDEKIDKRPVTKPFRGRSVTGSRREKPVEETKSVSYRQSSPVASGVLVSVDSHNSCEPRDEKDSVYADPSFHKCENPEDRFIKQEHRHNDHETAKYRITNMANVFSNFVNQAPSPIGRIASINSASTLASRSSMLKTAEQHLPSITTDYSALKYAFDSRETGLTVPIYSYYLVLSASDGDICLTQEQCQLFISATIDNLLAKYPVMSASELRKLGIHTDQDVETRMFATAVLLGRGLLGRKFLGRELNPLRELAEKQAGKMFRSNQNQLRPLKTEELSLPSEKTSARDVQALSLVLLLELNSGFHDCNTCDTLYSACKTIFERHTEEEWREPLLFDTWTVLTSALLLLHERVDTVGMSYYLALPFTKVFLLQERLGNWESVQQFAQRVKSMHERYIQQHAILDKQDSYLSEDTI